MRKKLKREARLARMREHRRTMTEAERTLWQRLRELPGGTSHFRRQDTIGPSLADFACHSRRVVVELEDTPRDLAAAFREAARMRKLETRGYRVLRFGQGEVLSDIDGVMQKIQASLNPNDPPSQS